ncbi:aspartate/glutamate racemase family protein [Roseomonas sp. AR75]|uniref:aspartate/glutamate racemase family protein n=1 Tax=Roseomonas sp. AR75 TaxID=2562311 RepID=UPI0010C05776|nr:aspartate/glutamate racemase family protein [Roseomonas sp. AR75]
MPASRKRLLLIQAFSLAAGSGYGMRAFDGPKEAMLMNYDSLRHLLADVDWEVHPGAPATHGNHPVETREEFAIVGVNRLPIVRAACESGNYDAIVLLGGGDPGFPEAREIGLRHGIPVTSCGNAQMHVASMLGNSFGIIDISEAHNMQMRELVVRYGFADRCRGIRNVNFPLPRPNLPDERPVQAEKAKHDRGETSDMVETAVRESVAAIEEDGADVLITGCSAAYWLAPVLQQRLNDMGWEVPVLEGYRCAIEQAKLLANLGVAASGLAFPSDRPRKWRRSKKI